MNNNFYNKKNQPFAHNLRMNMTKAEACLWKYVLRARQLRGYSFRRQRPVLEYIVDFMCFELQLIIEVDGYSHLLDEVIEKDIRKQKALEEAGYRVIRFTDMQILKDVRNVILELERIIDELE